MDDAEDDDSDIDDGLATSLGVLKVDNDKGKSMYIGQAHWHLILADISEVKTYFNNHKKELEKGYETVRNSKPASASDGYHRDPKWFPSLTPFQAEMRRRVWATVRMSDIFMSQHVALPAMIHDQDCDTELPSNVFDEDFGPETEIMPPPRPSTEPTPIAYALAKCRLGSL
ncbi:Equisetin cluster transcription factor eqxF like protein [Verticillium longisporum]|nr:Equisetin cluster transcription factor eqxF like protein [Verticillium longisporum]